VATDIKKIISNLFAFYDFTDRIVLSVGAGGGQFVEYGRAARGVIAIDQDLAALEKLHESVAAAGLDEKFTIVHSDFLSSDVKADVVLFEFCLHEMPDPAAAVRRARTLAPEVLILDHAPGSDWSAAAAEDEKVAHLWADFSMSAFRKVQTYHAVQKFGDYDELFQKVKGQGEVSLERIQRFRNERDIVIPMIYRFALI
jgi:hypothetical protein